MKVAVFGKGKTGSKVIEILQEQTDLIIFDSKTPPNKKDLLKVDALIAFVPSEVLYNYLDLFIDSKINLVSGATGLEWPSSINQRLVESNLKWISATNFSLGMNLIHKMISDVLKKVDLITNDYKFELSETHHTKKLDAPSGTAKSWHEWLHKDCEIESIREGDVIGLHELTLNLPSETIKLTHIAQDRSLFAKGSIKALKLLKDLKPGLHKFEDVVRSKLDV